MNPRRLAPVPGLPVGEQPGAAAARCSLWCAGREGHYSQPSGQGHPAASEAQRPCGHGEGPGSGSLCSLPCLPLTPCGPEPPGPTVLGAAPPWGLQVAYLLLRIPVWGAVRTWALSSDRPESLANYVTRTSHTFSEPQFPQFQMGKQRTRLIA